MQDVTDTWTALAMKRVGQVVGRDLRAIEDATLDMAGRYRDADGRAHHGQAGAPITFWPWKAASWADEFRRHIERLHQEVLAGWWANSPAP